MLYPPAALSPSLGDYIFHVRNFFRMNIKSYLRHWNDAGVIDDAIAKRILAYEKSRQRFQLSSLILGFGILALIIGLIGVIKLISFNWDAIPSGFKLAALVSVNLILVAGIWHSKKTNKSFALEILLFIAAGFTLSLITLIGQVYMIDAPIWMELALWLTIISPFLFVMARAKITVVCWFLAFFVTLGSVYESTAQLLLSHHLSGVIITIVPFIMIATGQYIRLRKIWPVWPQMLTATGYIFMASAVSLAQIAWTDGGSLNYMDDVERLKLLVPAFFTGLLGTAALYALRCFRLDSRKFIIADIFTLASVIWGFAPLFFVPRFYWSEWHVHREVAGAGLFMLYWLFIGWAGIKSGSRAILNAAVIMISFRLVAIYVGVFIKLIPADLGLMIVGALLIAIVLKTQKIMRKLG